MKQITKLFLFLFLTISWTNVSAQSYYYGEFQKEELEIHGKFLLTLKEDKTFTFASKINTESIYIGNYQEQEEYIILNLQETLGSDICIYETPKETWNMLKKVDENIEYSINDEPILLTKLTEEEIISRNIIDVDTSELIYCQELKNPATKEGYYQNENNEFVLYQDNQVIWYEDSKNYKIGTYHVEENTLNFDFTTECIGEECFTTNKAMNLRISFKTNATLGGTDFEISYQGKEFKQVTRNKLNIYREADRETKVDPKQRHYYIYIGVTIVIIIFIISKLAFRHRK